MNLSSFSPVETGRVFHRLPDRPYCLIEGITAPGNGTALRRFLYSLNITPGSVCAIDIVDVERVAHSAGRPLTDAQFCIADAANLQGWADGSVDLLVQDHLLNCAPHVSHAQIVSEAARVLNRQGGIWILNFSVDPRMRGREPIPIEEVERRLGYPWFEEAYSVVDITGDPVCPPDLHGHLVEHSGEQGRYTMITAPSGNLEFFFRFDTLRTLVENAGLAFAQINSARECDSQGLSCRRYRTLVVHAR